MEQQPFITDTAKTTDITNKKSITKNVRDEIFDSIVNSGIECYVALRTDILNKPRIHLFRGQVGTIERVLLEDENQHCYLVIFIDYKKDHDEFYRCLVKKENLLPLFCFDPDIYKEYKKTEQTQSINEIRDNWELFQFDVTPKLQFVLHKKVSTRFKIGQLVTIEVDFEQKTDAEPPFVIQAGQTGIISASINDDVVEVTFWSMPFGLLAVIREGFLSSSLPSSPEANLAPLSYATSSWERKIFIDKNFLFPLYVENLDVEDLR
jgi:hypothetical protein